MPPRVSGTRSLLLTTLVLLSATKLASCSGGTDTASETATATATGTPVALPTRPAAVSSLSLEPQEVLPSDVSGEEYAEYTSFVEDLLESVNGYWTAWFEERGEGSWRAPEARGRPADGSSHFCMEREVTFRGSFFCPDSYYIALEEPRQLLPLYLQIGPYALAAVVAHEHGHAVQQQLNIDHITSRKTESQAECFAGAWFGWRSENGELDDAEAAIGQAYDAMRTVNTDDELIRQFDAFAAGFADGPERCIELWPDEPTDNPVRLGTATPTPSN